MTIYQKEKSRYSKNKYKVVPSDGGPTLKDDLSAKHANRLLKLTRLVHEVDLKLRSFNLKIGDIN